MRIERINENSIRCVLTNFDLSVRNVKLSELTYGSEKAKGLFREMMQRASSEVGFDAEDIPIMIEAIPMANDSIMLIITKIDDPEELDTRFSRFAPSEEEDNAPWNSFATELLEGADEIMNLLGDPALLEKLAQAGGNLGNPDGPSGFGRPNLGDVSGTGNGISLAGSEINASAEPGKTTGPAGLSQNPAQLSQNAAQPNAPQNVRIYQFNNLDLVCAAAKETHRIFTGESILYKNPVNEKFYLLLKKESCDELAFSKTCNRLSEYASRQKYEPATEAYFAEHYEVFVKKNVLQVLANL